MLSGLLSLLFALIVLGIIAWAASRLLAKVPMPDWVRVLVIAVLALICVAIAWNFLVPMLAFVPTSPHTALR